MSDQEREAAASASGGWVPEFEGQRPPFAPGNVPANAFEPGNVPVTATHGAYSPRKVEPLARELVELVLSDDTTSYLRARRWGPAMWAWGRAEAQVQLLSEWLAERGEETGDGVGDLDSERVRAAYLLLHRAETRATTGRTRLGLDPLSAARLGRDVAQGQAANVDVALQMARLHELEQQGWTPPPGWGDPPPMPDQPSSEERHDDEDGADDDRDD